MSRYSRYCRWYRYCRYWSTGLIVWLSVDIQFLLHSATSLRHELSLCCHNTTLQAGLVWPRSGLLVLSYHQQCGKQDCFDCLGSYNIEYTSPGSPPFYQLLADQERQVRQWWQGEVRAGDHKMPPCPWHPHPAWSYWVVILVIMQVREDAQHKEPDCRTLTVTRILWSPAWCHHVIMCTR